MPIEAKSSLEGILRRKMLEAERQKDHEEAFILLKEWDRENKLNRASRERYLTESDCPPDLK